MVKVFYNGIDVFSGVAPTPFIGIDDEFISYGQRWGVSKKITLQGMVTGICSDSYSDLIFKQNKVFSGFREDFKNLEIKQDGQSLFSGKYIKVNSIDFDQSNYVGMLNFTIDLTSYSENLFTGTYGVLDPVSTIKYTEQQDGTVAITRSFSARGFNTSNGTNNALSNARSYVQSLTGVSSLILPKFINITPSQSNLCPRKISETVNRFNSEYSIDIDYLLRKGARTSSIISYNVDADYDDERGLYTASINGNLDGGSCKTMAQLRAEFANFKPYNITLTNFTKLTNYTYLNIEPESFSINENDIDNKIDFNYSYTSDPQDIKFDYNIDINNEFLTDQVSVGFNGTLTARGPESSRLAKAEAALNNLNIIPLCQQFYLQNVTNPSLPMNTNAKNYSVKRDRINGTISIQSSFDNSQIPPAGFKTFEWNLSITPSINKYNPIQYLDGNNGAFNLNMFSRGQISVQGSATFETSDDKTSLVRNKAIEILNLYTVGFSNRLRVEDRVERNLRAEDNGYTYSFTISDTAETSIFSI
jgi:hypothetical protein